MKKIIEYLNEKVDKQIEELFDAKWFKIVNVTYDNATITGLWKEGRNAVVLPFTATQPEEGKLTIEKVGVRYELNPLRAENFTYTAITGDIEPGEEDLEGAKRELLEESGYTVSDDERWIFLGNITTSKQTNELHPCYAVNISEIEQGEIEGDGTVNEQKSKFELLDPEKIFELEDTFLNTALLKLLNNLGAF